VIFNKTLKFYLIFEDRDKPV